MVVDLMAGEYYLLMNRYVASSQASTSGIVVHSRYKNVNHIRRTKFAQRIYIYSKSYCPPAIHNPYTGEPSVIAFNHQHVEGYGFQAQIGFVILIGQVTFWSRITFSVIYGEAECSLGGFLL